MSAKALAALLLLLTAPEAFGQQHYTPEVRAAARGMLFANDIDAEVTARARLAQKGELYDIQRVEITGMMSDDDTEESFPGLFSPAPHGQIKPSYRNVIPEVNKKPKAPRSFDSMVRWWLDSVAMPSAIVNYASGQTMVFSMDGIEAGDATMRGRLSPREKEVLAPLKRKEVGEIVAHSWGTELLYNAILAGEIRPPRNIVIIGSPDRNVEKWRVLADRTGTNVRIFGGKKDLVNSVVQFVPGALPLFVPKDRKRLLDLWNARCTDRQLDACNPYRRTGTVEASFDLPVGGHDRFEYYRHVGRRGYLLESAKDLQDMQDQRVESELDVLAEPYLERAFAQLREEAARGREALEQGRPTQESSCPRGMFCAPRVHVEAPVAVAPLEPPVAYAPPPPPEAYAPPVAAPPRVYAPPPSYPPQAADELVQTAKKLCANPATPRESLPPLAWFPAPRLPSSELDGRRGLMTVCELQLLEAMLARNSLDRLLDLDELRRLATPTPSYEEPPAEKDRPCTPRGIWHKECY